MKKGELHVFGVQPVLELLRSHSKLVVSLYTEESPKEARFEEARLLAREARIPINIVPRKKFDEYVGDVNHQGIVALVKSFPYHDFNEWIGMLDMEKDPTILILDEITDTHNFGAIARTAVAFGIDAILVQKHRQAVVNSTVFKTSSGMILGVPIVQVGNLNQALEALKEKRFWIAGLDGEGKNILWDQDFSGPMAFIIGSEGHGIGEKTLEACDYRVKIPIQENVESLNASVAAALVCYEWARQKKASHKK